MAAHEPAQLLSRRSLLLACSQIQIESKQGLAREVELFITSEIDLTCSGPESDREKTTIGSGPEDRVPLLQRRCLAGPARLFVLIQDFLVHLNPGTRLV